MIIPATCELWINGVRYADGQPAEDPDEPAALSGLVIRWGRSNTVDQPAPATCSFTIADRPGGSTRFDDTVALGSKVVVWAELDGTRMVVFGGRVTDLDAQWDDSIGGVTCDVVAADQLAEMGNRFVGAEPWPLEQLWQRATRVLQSISVPTSGLNVATRPALLPVSRMDVDRQAAADLLVELAVTGGAVLWCAYDAAGAPYIYFEDPATRASLYQLVQNVTTLLWAPAVGTGAGTPLSSCEVLRDPVQWARAVTDLITRVTVRWRDQSTAPSTTERSIGLIDSSSEVAYGSRGLSIGTLLTTQTDAQNLATGMLAAHQPSPAWRTDGLSWDLAQATADTPAHRALVRTLLDNKARLGYAIALTELPWWTPTGAAVQLYIEGGTYRYELGRWILALEGSPASGLGSSLTYGQTDKSIRYADLDCSVSFLEMIGVGPAGPTGPTWAAQTVTWSAAIGKWSDQV